MLASSPDGVKGRRGEERGRRWRGWAVWESEREIMVYEEGEAEGRK